MIFSFACFLLHEFPSTSSLSFILPSFVFPSPSSSSPIALLLIFMILMPILLMNLLIGLAVGDIESVKKNAQLKRIAMQVKLTSPAFPFCTPHTLHQSIYFISFPSISFSTQPSTLFPFPSPSHSFTNTDSCR